MIGCSSGDAAEIKVKATDQSYQVSYVDDATEMIFTHGWRKFVKEKGITEAEFLQFTYHGSPKFIVVVYRLDLCEKARAMNPSQQAGLLVTKGKCFAFELVVI